VDAVAHILVPIKRERGKSRLADVLSPATRALLVGQMLDIVLAAAKEADIGPVTVVSAAKLSLNGTAQYDDGGAEWNEGLAAAMRAVVTEPVAAVVSADLPKVTGDDIRALVAATPERGMAIARAHDGGTNAVAMRPAGAVMTHFGEQQSAAVHAQTTAAAGLAARIIDLPGLAFDVDTPDDLDELSRLGWSWPA
jgi:2-phospho-L-lactate guanylyltransferase